jgi:hypothetical protein
MSKATDTSGCGTNGRALPPAAPLPPPNVRGTSYGDMLAAAGLDSNASDTAATPRSPMRRSLKKDALLRLQPAPGLNPELSLKTIASFGAPEFGLSVANAVQGPQVLTLYTDVLGLPLGTFTVRASNARQCDGRAHQRERVRVCVCVCMCVYVHVCMCMCVRVCVYVWPPRPFALVCPPTQVAAAVAKSVDLICGFGLGYATDTLRSRFGRRRPFIVLGAILTALGSVGIVRPKPTLEPTRSQARVTLAPSTP